MKKKAFTLAEIIVVLTLLGVVAAITIPNALDNSSKKSNVVRIKKALPVFERAIEQMRIANNLTNMEELVNYANEGGECANIRKEFKIKKYSDEENASKCIFQTNDGVWWNMTNIEKPIISPLKDGYKYLTADNADKLLTDEGGKNAFYLTLMQGNGSLGYAFLANDPNHESDLNKCDIKKTLVYAKIMDENELCSGNEDDIEYKLVDLDPDYSIKLSECIVAGELVKPCYSNVKGPSLFFSEPIPNDKINSIEDGEYFWDKAKIYCDRNHARLPSIAELVSSGICPTNRCWGAEEYSSSSASPMAHVTRNGKYDGGITKFSYGDVSTYCVKDP